MATGSFATGLALLTWAIAGLAVCCERLLRQDTQQLAATRFQPSAFAASQYSSRFSR
jgi:hypothetical protein